MQVFSLLSVRYRPGECLPVTLSHIVGSPLSSASWSREAIYFSQDSQLDRRAKVVLDLELQSGGGSEELSAFL